MNNACDRCGKTGTMELLDPETGLLYCFACGQPRYPEQKIQLINGKGPDAEQIAKCKEICAAACEFYQKQLHGPEGGKARAYLQERKMSAESIRKFGLGYAPAHGRALLDHLIALGYQIEDISVSGLVSTENNVAAADHVRGRLIIPLRNAIGETVAFSGRRLSDTSSSIKYLNSLASPIYRRNNLLFNQYSATGSGKGFWIITEGYTDVISLDWHGFPNVISTMGTALTEFQIKLIAGNIREVVVLFDGDGPGADAMYQAIEKLSLTGLTVSSLILPGKHDPDSYLRTNGPGRLAEEIERARQCVAPPRSEYASLSDKNYLLALCRKL